MINTLVAFDTIDNPVCYGGENDFDTDFEDVITDDDCNQYRCIKYPVECYHDKYQCIDCLSYQSRANRTSPKLTTVSPDLELSKDIRIDKLSYKICNDTCDHNTWSQT